MLLYRNETCNDKLVTGSGGVVISGSLDKLDSIKFKDKDTQKEFDNMVSNIPDSYDLGTNTINEGKRDFLFYVGNLKEIEEDVICLPPEELLGKKRPSKGSK